ncbi:MAG: septum formation initiator [Paenibacillaceae bacterium]|jgi:cell division protein DivIC|nr:septum formation initiator [Paenibacillaceae bacterium]
MPRQQSGAPHAGSAVKSNKIAASRKRIRLVTVGVLALSLWAGATAWTQMKKTAETAERIDVLNAKLMQTTELNTKLKREVERLSDPEYLQERIRKDNHMFMQGETVFDVPRANP